MKSIYTVRQINGYIQNMFAQDYLLTSVSVQGEVSNCKYHSSGHIYFSLKDESGTIKCVMFAGSRSGLKFRMEDGQQVVVSGSVSVYVRDGAYQLYARAIIRNGLGALYERYEQLKAELESMGMFAPEYKQRIPSFIRTLGVVTAPTGAAVRDIIQISKRRNPGIQIILYPALVQGEGAADSIVTGIRTLEKAGVDTIIIGRGGGSIEDLWAFNEEKVARAVFDCSVPVISAVGHETDTVITDYVADLRAPTPSAAAELAVNDVQTVYVTLENYKANLMRIMERRIQEKRSVLQRDALRLRLHSPQARLNDYKQTLSIKSDSLTHAMNMLLTRRRSELAVREERLRGLSPYDKMSSGYGFVTDANGKRVTGVSGLKQGDSIRVYFADGHADAVVSTTVKEETGHGDD